jgi:hypothetical protein
LNKWENIVDFDSTSPADSKWGGAMVMSITSQTPILVRHYPSNIIWGGVADIVIDIRDSMRERLCYDR